MLLIQSSEFFSCTSSIINFKTLLQYNYDMHEMHYIINTDQSRYSTYAETDYMYTPCVNVNVYAFMYKYVYVIHSQISLLVVNQDRLNLI